VQWFVEKGYGFIEPDDRGADNVFLHVSQLSHKTSTARGSVVTFQSTFDRVKKSEVAYNVRVVEDAVDSTRCAFATNSNTHLPSQYRERRYCSPSSPSRSTARRTQEHGGVCIQYPCMSSVFCICDTIPPPSLECVHSSITCGPDLSGTRVCMGLVQKMHGNGVN